MEQKSPVIWVRIVVLGLQSERTRCRVSGTLKSQVSAEVHFVAREMYWFLFYEFFVALCYFM